MRPTLTALTAGLVKMDLNTVFGPFKVDHDGFQVARKWLMFQWQNGRKVILWPEELAPGKPWVISSASSTPTTRAESWGAGSS